MIGSPGDWCFCSNEFGIAKAQNRQEGRTPLEQGRNGLVEGHFVFYFSAKSNLVSKITFGAWGSGYNGLSAELFSMGGTILDGLCRSAAGFRSVVPFRRAVLDKPESHQ